MTCTHSEVWHRAPYEVFVPVPIEPGPGAVSVPDSQPVRPCAHKLSTVCGIRYCIGYRPRPSQGERLSREGEAEPSPTTRRPPQSTTAGGDHTSISTVVVESDGGTSAGGTCGTRIPRAHCRPPVQRHVLCAAQVLLCIKHHLHSLFCSWRIRYFGVHIATPAAARPPSNILISGTWIWMYAVRDNPFCLLYSWQSWCRCLARRRWCGTRRRGRATARGRRRAPARGRCPPRSVS